MKLSNILYKAEKRIKFEQLQLSSERVWQWRGVLLLWYMLPTYKEGNKQPLPHGGSEDEKTFLSATEQGMRRRNHIIKTII